MSKEYFNWKWFFTSSDDIELGVCCSNEWIVPFKVNSLISENCLVSGRRHLGHSLNQKYQIVQENGQSFQTFFIIVVLYKIGKVSFLISCKI